ncbi:MAG TPA: OmpA family protein, partial [Saprospiraceae bacterium]|nr:OmpA family protein [Saprospiraceae bacterium]
EANRDKLQKLYEGWMIGAAEINSDPAAKRKAAEILAREFTDRGTPLSNEESMQMLDNVRLCTHGDNRNFFGLNSDYKGVNGNALYSRMSGTYSSLGYMEASSVPNWRRVAFPSLVTSANLSGTEHNAEGQKQFTKVTTDEGKDREAFASKQVSISFRSGEFQLDENAKYIIDKEFVEIAKAFGSARIRIEGNTDNVGSRESNVALSQKRAQSVANYLVREHGMSSNRFIVVGNGPDKPVAPNTTDDGRSKNRRTDFELVKD